MSHDEFITPEEWGALIQRHGRGADWRMYGKDLVIFACLTEDGEAEVRVYSPNQIKEALGQARLLLQRGDCLDLATGLARVNLHSLV